MTSRLFLVALAVISIGVSTSAEHWPQWRGPLLNGISGERALPVRWSTTENIAWKLAVPERSGATPIVWGEHVFLNVGETHVPYYYEGAPWDVNDNPCVPFQTADRSGDCRLRQRACVEFVDRAIGPLLDRFLGASIVLCSDHGDCWGEDGLWEHGISHEMTLTVPLLIRLRGRAIDHAG